MSDIDEEAQELANDIMRHELKASKVTTELFGKYGKDDGLQAIYNSVQRVIDNSDSTDRKMKALGILHGMATQFEDEELIEIARKGMKELEDA